MTVVVDEQRPVSGVVIAVDNCDCLWHLEVSWMSEGRTGTFRVDGHGKPFRTTSAPLLLCHWVDGDTPPVCETPGRRSPTPS